MKRTLLIAAILLLALSFIGLVYASSYSYVDEAGILHDSMWLPISGLANLFGWALLIGSAFLYLLQYLKDRRNT